MLPHNEKEKSGNLATRLHFILLANDSRDSEILGQKPAAFSPKKSPISYLVIGLWRFVN
jgi:hypothetical protein